MEDKLDSFKDNDSSATQELVDWGKVWSPCSTKGGIELVAGVPDPIKRLKILLP